MSSHTPSLTCSKPCGVQQLARSCIMNTKIISCYQDLKITPENILTEHSYNQIEELYLNNNALILPPNEVSKLINLKHLSLECNSLTLLPHELGSLSQLRFLNVSFNELVCLPDSLANLTFLEELWLTECGLTEFPYQIMSLKNLKKLSLARNKINTIPEELCGLVHLRWMSLGSNLINALPPNILQNMTQLRVLHLYDNVFVNFPLYALLKNTHLLAVLNLHNNRIKSLRQDCALWLISSCNLVKLDLRGNPVAEDQDNHHLPWRKLDFIFT